MFFPNSKASLIRELPVRTADRVSKIRSLMARALGEVYRESQRSPSSSPCKLRSEESSDSESIGEILERLRKGYLMVKLSARGSSSCSKFVYLSEDNLRLCWKSVEKSDEKGMALAEVVRVVHEGAEFFVKGNAAQNITSCVVVVGRERNLQLEAGS